MRLVPQDLFDLFTDPRLGLKPEDRSGLWAYARQQRGLGDGKLFSFLLARKDLVALLSRMAEALRAPAEQRRAQMSRLDILRDELQPGNPCTCPQATPSPGFAQYPVGFWKFCANQIVNLNGYSDYEVQEALLLALVHGREKKRTVWFLGETNRAKSFVLKGIAKIYHTFVPPDTGSHRLMDLNEAEVIFLNDFTYNPDLIPWDHLKNLLENGEVKIGVPKDGKGRNYIFSRNVPVFGTSAREIALVVRGEVVWAEVEQMRSRVSYFPFTYFFDPDEVPAVPPCRRCTAEWLEEAAQALEGRPPRRPPPPPPPQFRPRSKQARAARRRWNTELPKGEHIRKSRWVLLEGPLSPYSRSF